MISSRTLTRGAAIVLLLTGCDDGCARVAGKVAEEKGVEAGDARIVQLAAAPHRTCVVFDDGRLACWGCSPDIDRARPAWLEEQSVAAIAMGDDHDCILYRDGKLACRGSNQYRQLGRGKLGEGPFPLAPVEGIGKVSAVYAGESETCAVAEGIMQCWGGSRGMREKKPHLMRVARGQRVVTASVSNYDHVVIVDSGDVLWWGMPFSFGSHNGRFWASPDEPATVAIKGRARHVCAERFHSCAIAEGGTVHCWGRTGIATQRLGFLPDNDSERAEYWPMISKEVASLPTPPPVDNVEDAVELSCAMGHTCARLRSGKVKCWGGEDHGTVNPDTGWKRFSAHTVDGIDDAMGLASGWEHTCALRKSGGVSCWGANKCGELGDGTKEWRTSPVNVQFAPNKP